MTEDMLGDHALDPADDICVEGTANAASATAPTAAHHNHDPFASAAPLDTNNLAAALASARKAFVDAGDNGECLKFRVWPVG